jgi:5-methyltetrahydrofolate--homocysteine methyltransferase
MSETHATLVELAEKLYAGDAPGVLALCQRSLAEGLSARTVLDQGLLAGMEIVGRDFKAGELFLPEIIVAARAMHAGIEVLRPLLAEGAGGLASARKAVLGTVKGDLHDIGKKLVGIMLEGAGFQVIDLGHDVAPERFVETVRAERPALVGLSALLSTTMPMMRTTIAALEAAGLAAGTTILVGGAPVTAAFAKQIGAHGHAPDAVSAVERAEELCAARGS